MASCYFLAHQTATFARFTWITVLLRGKPMLTAKTCFHLLAPITTLQRFPSKWTLKTRECSGVSQSPNNLEQQAKTNTTDIQEPSAASTWQLATSHGQGKSRTAAPFTTLFHLVPSSLKRYAEQFPNVELTILDRSQQDILELVKNGEIDFGFLLESNAYKDLIVFRWKKVQTVLMTPLNHPLTKVKKITLKHIAKYPLILPPVNLKYRSNLEERFQKQGVDCRIIMESSNVELSALYVEMGLGISFATVVTDLPDLKQRELRFLSMDHLFKPDYIAVVMRKGKTLLSFKHAFISILFGEPATSHDIFGKSHGS